MENTDTPRNPNIDEHLGWMRHLHDLIRHAARAEGTDAGVSTVSFRDPEPYINALAWALAEHHVHGFDRPPKPSKNRDRIDALERGMERLTRQGISHGGMIDMLHTGTGKRDDYLDSIRVRMEDQIDRLSERLTGLDNATSEALAFASADRQILRQNIGDVSDELTRQIQERRSENQDTLDRFRDRLDRLTELVGSEPSGLRAEVDGLADRIRHVASRVDDFTGARPKSPEGSLQGRINVPSPEEVNAYRARSRAILHSYRASVAKEFGRIGIDESEPTEPCERCQLLSEDNADA